MTTDKTKIGIILNPVAGRGRGKNAEESIVKYLRKRKLNFQLEKTSYRGHATQIARQMCKESRIVIAVGGDGTVSETAAGMVKNASALAILPIGSGNDFNKMIGIPKQIDQALNCILNGRKKQFELGQIKYRNVKNEEKNRFFVNTLGMGLDAEIAFETQNIKFLRGLPLYMLAAVKALIHHNPNEYSIKEDKIIRYEKAFFICIGNGCFEGGGFKLTPKALPDDSELEMCIIQAMPIMKAIRLVPGLIAGNHYKHNSVSMSRIKKVRIDGKRPFVLHSDGEILEKNAIRAEVEIAKNKLTMIVPA
jgi:diacylglycerol kinase (ATP)